MRRAVSIASSALFILCVLAAQASAAVTRTKMVPMADGVKLATDLYLPAQGAGPWPVVLVRTPYDKAQSAQTGENLQKYNSVVTVIQDMRGRFASEGTDCVFTCDADDGHETVAWILAQQWSNGKVLTDGGSALGIVQYLLAGTNPPGLKAMIVDVATPDLYDFMFPGGVWRQHDVEGWLQGQGSSFFLDTVTQHPLQDAVWDSVTVSKKFAQVNVPAIHTGGWFDIFTQGIIDAFTGFQTQGGAGAKGKQKMVIGPWTHGGRDVKQGQLTFPANATVDALKLYDLHIDWMVHHLGIQDKTAVLAAVPTVQYYTMGACGETGAPGNEWRSSGVWPIPAAPTRLYLHAAKKLSTDCPSDALASSKYTCDPADPSPTVGGANLTLQAGPYDQAISVETRSDVAIFSSDALAGPVEVTGLIRLHAWVSIDTVDTDLTVRLTDVYPDGRSMLVTDAPYRLATRGKKDSLQMLTPGEVYEIEMNVGSTSMIFNKGHKIRIIVSSSNAPRFRPNPNDGTSYGQQSAPKKVNVTLYHDKDHPSYLETPDPSLDPSTVNLCQNAFDGGTDGGTCAAPDGGIDTGTDVENPGDGSLPIAQDAGTGGDSGPITGEATGCSCTSVGL